MLFKSFRCLVASLGLSLGLLLVLSCAPAAEMNDGLVQVDSGLSFDETVLLVRERISTKGLNLFAMIDHTQNAKGVGLELRPTMVIIFGNPNIGTLFMQDKASFAIDLPQKILITEENGKVSLYYNDPSYLKNRHQVGDSLDPSFEKVKGLLAGLTGDIK